MKLLILSFVIGMCNSTISFYFLVLVKSVTDILHFDG